MSHSPPPEARARDWIVSTLVGATPHVVIAVLLILYIGAHHGIERADAAYLGLFEIYVVPIELLAAVALSLSPSTRRWSGGIGSALAVGGGGVVIATIFIGRASTWT